MAGRLRYPVSSTVDIDNSISKNSCNDSSSSPLIPISSPNLSSSAGHLHQTNQEKYSGSKSTVFQPPMKYPCWPISYKITCIRSKGAILVLVLNLLVLTCVNGAYGILLPPILENMLHIEKKHVDNVWKTTLIPMVRLVVYLFYPLAGWLADTYFSRHKTIISSMWIVCFAILTTTVLISLRYAFPDHGYALNVHTYIYPVLFVLMTVGLAGFHANVVPFGTDQLQDAPGYELVVFVRWYVWTFSLSSLPIPRCAGIDHTVHALVLSCAHSVCITLALSIYFLFQHCLLKEPAAGNPFTTIFHVLNYARKHQYARFRSAFTYWDGERPSRIDFAKMRYGGPFLTEQVEDVKTFYRMLSVLATLLVIFTAAAASTSTMGLLSSHMSYKPDNHSFLFCLLDSWLDNLPFCFPVLSIPLFHFFVNPFTRNCQPTSLKGIGIGTLLFTASILCALTLDTVGHACKPGNVSCLFSLNSTSGHNILLDYRLVLLPGILGGLAWPFVAIGVYKFICAQSPHQTKGTFIGIYYCVLGVGFAFGFVLMLPFYLQSSISWPMSCGFWYYLINAVIMLAGFFIFSVVAKHYKRRRRDDPSFEQANIEAYYEAKVSL